MLHDEHLDGSGVVGAYDCNILESGFTFKEFLDPPIFPPDPHSSSSLPSPRPRHLSPLLKKAIQADSLFLAFSLGL
jgi:hypothetical protein